MYDVVYESTSAAVSSTDRYVGWMVSTSHVASCVILSYIARAGRAFSPLCRY